MADGSSAAGRDARRWSRSKKVLVVLGAAALALLMALPALSATRRVRVGDDFFDPQVRKARKGNFVRWANVGEDDHTVTSYGRRGSLDRTLSPGEAFRKRFRRRGRFKYRCEFHSNVQNGDCSGMCGVVRVRRRR
ncbi:MAG: cupredoxin domain-containing protein [Actinomycetota bacterium]